MATPWRTSQRVRFGEFELDLSTRELWNNGSKQTLAPQPFQLLKLLIENPGQLVSRDSLVKHLWPSDTFVDYEQGLKKAVNRLREALNDSAEQPRFIENLPRQGYRFIGELEAGSGEHDRPPKPIALTPQLVTEELKSTRTGRLPVPSSSPLWVLAGLVGAGVILFWQVRASRRQESSPEPRLTQLTANSYENPVVSSAISPDGKYLAFTDNAMRIWVKLLETGETQVIPESESLTASSADWTIAAWFPDSTRFIVNARPRGSLPRYPAPISFLINSRAGSAATSMWIVSILGKTPQKLRDDGDAFSISPDGSTIAFGTNVGQLGDREIWLMDSKGLQERKLYGAPENKAIAGLAWSPEGERAIYFQRGTTTGELVSRDLRGGPAIPLVQFSDWRNLTHFLWLPDGRLIYARGEDWENRYCNFWELRIDPQSSKSIGEPRQLTNWPGVCVGETSLTADGKRLAFQRWAKQTTVSNADIEANGARISSTRRLTLNEYVNAAETWTPDSKALIFRSLRDGRLRLFRQRINSDTEEPLVMGAENVGGSAISPDGSWLFYLNCGTLGPPCDGTVPLMAIPIQGGAPHQVLTSNTYGRPRCVFAPANLCAIAEQSEDGKPLIFTAFDALGRGAVIATFETEPAASYMWSLSPDATRIAILNHRDDRIHIVSLNGKAPREVTIKHGLRAAGVYWAADGKGWFTVTRNQAGIVLLYVDLEGEPHPLWDLKGDTIAYGLPSPDGRHLAIVATARNNNVWLMENF